MVRLITSHTVFVGSPFFARMICLLVNSYSIGLLVPSDTLGLYQIIIIYVLGQGLYSYGLLFRLLKHYLGVHLASIDVRLLFSSSIPPFLGFSYKTIFRRNYSRKLFWNKNPSSVYLKRFLYLSMSASSLPRTRIWTRPARKADSGWICCTG